MMQYIEIKKRMNRFSRVIPLVGLCLTMASCNDTEGTIGLSSEPVALGIGTIDVPDQPSTRAGVTTGKIGIYVTKSDFYPSITNREGAYSSSSKWTPGSPIWLNNKDAEVAVVWPKQSGNATFGLQAKEWDSLEDIFSGKRTDVNNQNGATLTFDNLKPVYTRLKLTVNKVDTYKGPGKWSKISLSGANIYQQGNYNPLTEKVDAQSGVGYTQTFSSEKSIDGGVIDLRLLPVDALTDDMTLVLTVDGKDMSVKVPKDKFNGTKMERGTYYELAVKVSTIGVIIQSLKFNEWENIDGTIESGTSQS